MQTYKKLITLRICCPSNVIFHFFRGRGSCLPSSAARTPQESTRESRSNGAFLTRDLLISHIKLKVVHSRNLPEYSVFVSHFLHFVAPSAEYWSAGQGVQLKHKIVDQ